MYRFTIFLAVLALCGGALARLHGAQAPEGSTLPASAQTKPAPTGRTLEDVRQAYIPPAVKRAMTMLEEEALPPAAPTRIVEANVFAVTDCQGNVRAELGATDGGGRMRMFDAGGKLRLALAEEHGVATVTLLGDNGQTALQLQLTSTGRATVTLGSAEPRAAALTLAAGPRESPAISLRNAAGEQVVDISSHEDAGGIVEVHAAQWAGRLQPGGLSLWTPGIGPRASLTLHNGNRAQLNLSRGGGTKTELELGCAGEASWLTLGTAGMGSAHVMASDFASSITLRPAGGEGEAYLGIRHADGRSEPELHLSDTDSLVQVQMKLLGSRPWLYMFDDDGKTLFKAP